jgi:electron transport complex protein RnfE
MSLVKDLTRGLFRENPTFRLVLGMCPTLAVTTSLDNAIGMGAATTFVLVGSNMAIAAVRKIVPPKVRIPCFVVLIATFVTIVDQVMQACAPALTARLGIFIPLIVVNCIVFARAESFACKNPVLNSAADGLGMGAGFTLAISLIASIRELLGAGSLTVWGDNIKFVLPVRETLIMLILPAGGFVTLGCLLALMNHWQARQARRAGKAPPPPLRIDCRHCPLCKSGA